MTDRELAGCALLPCPFCGGSDLRVFGDAPPYEMLLGGFKVQCENPNCQAGGRYSGQREKAVAAWNNRPSLLSRPDGGDARDAARWRWAKRHFRVMGLEMSGQHHWVANAPFGRVRGPTIDAAIDAAIAAAAGGGK